MAGDFALAEAAVESTEPSLGSVAPKKAKASPARPRKQSGAGGKASKSVARKTSNAAAAASMEIDDLSFDRGDDEAEADGETDDNASDDGRDEATSAGPEAAGQAISPAARRKGPKKAVVTATPGTAVFPIARLKKLIKADVDVDAIGADSTFLLSVAANVFINRLTSDALGVLRMEGGKRKAISYGDLVRATKQSEDYEFLLDVLPEQLPLEQALKRSQLNQPGEDAAEEEAAQESRENEERMLDTQMAEDLPEPS